eukprot:TRINITY_DN49012_c0_g1_i1.p1 TRINITY_DN49012_c0_g1~~TRINITY_DN49012_c0_g1_i1.p1  ORF type:complete len:298 (-),score=-3.79 TRINITY_DN49012_c0_g1_i1:189-1082(-)
MYRERMHRSHTWKKHMRGRIIERHCRPTRDSKILDECFVSHAEFAAVAKELAKTVLPMQSIFYVPREGCDLPFDGHCCFVEGADQVRRVYSVHHNVRDPTVGPTKMRFIRASVCNGTKNGSWDLDCDAVIDDPPNLANTVTLKTGDDLSKSDKLELPVPTRIEATNPILTDKTLQKATIQLNPGMKVAIVVYRTWDFDDPEVDCGEKLDTEALKRDYGEKNQVAVLCGEITAVHDEVIEYNINTFEGCSGAAIVLLEGAEKGKVIGVHSEGYKKEVLVGEGDNETFEPVITNFGFRL